MSLSTTELMETTEAPIIPEGLSFLTAIVYFIVGPLMIILCIWHGIKLYQDLFSAERKSVSHRRNQPNINKNYKWVNYLTFVAIICFAISIWMGVINTFLTTHEGCDIGVTIIICSVQLSKTAMYCVFLIRLYTVYEKSAFRYSLKCVWIFAIILIVYCIGICLWMITMGAAVVYLYGDDTFHNYCFAGGFAWLVATPLLVLQDFGSVIGFLIAFLIPLKKTLKTIEDSADSKVNRKIIYAGTKTIVLTLTALVSTVTLIMATGMSGIAIFSLLDAPINVICLMFMTAYYNDKIYYQKWCCCCIKCCNKLGRTDTSDAIDDQSVKSNETNENEPTRTVVTEITTNAASSTGQTATDTKSVDTMSQLKVAGTNMKNDYDGNNNQMQEIPEVTPEPENQ